jgi:hypothetical protein
MRALKTVTQHGAGAWSVHGVGVGGFVSLPMIDCGTGTGVVDHGHHGHHSDDCHVHRRALRKRPMGGDGPQSLFGTCLWAQGRASADDRRWRSQSSAGAMHFLRRFGAGEIRRSAGWAERPGQICDRERTHPRP